jgi:TRAP-type uncharacterized transport system fused permease subunit
MMDISAIYSVLWASIAVILISFILKETRPTFRAFVEACKDGSIMAARIGVSCACIGMLASALQVTQLAMRLPDIIEALSFGSVFVTLIWSAFVGVVLGCGMPGMAVYIILVIAAVPILLNMGINKEAAHLFSVYYAVFAAITPPVALATIVAARVAGADYWKAGWQGVKIGVVGLTIPFVFIYRPELLMAPGTTVSSSITTTAVTVVAYFALTAFLNRYALVDLSARDLFVSGIAAAALLLYLVAHSSTALVVGLAAACLLVITQIVARRKLTLLISSTKSASISR